MHELMMIKPNKHVLIVNESGNLLLSPSEINIDIIGEKAYGLSIIPEKWSMPFLVICSDFFNQYKVSRDMRLVKARWEVSILNAIDRILPQYTDFYLRSNLCSEDMSERGRYNSYKCNRMNLFTSIESYFDELLSESVFQCTNVNVPLLLQAWTQVLCKGHITNERRVAKEARDWAGEIEQENWRAENLSIISHAFSISIRQWRRKVAYSQLTLLMNESLLCVNSEVESIALALYIPCAWVSACGARIHFEWVFNGVSILLLQLDQELSYGVNPLSLAQTTSYRSASSIEFEVIKNLQNYTADDILQFKKIQNPLLYKKLGFPTSSLYILDEPHEIQLLKKNEISQALVRDLKHLLNMPLVIRVDIASSNQCTSQMLPRTDEIKSQDEAVRWLMTTSKQMATQYGDEQRFISSAFAYAEPGNKFVSIESTWGLPEGLYYYSHDKFFVDTCTVDIDMMNTHDFLVTKKLNHKNNFVHPDQNGKWLVSAVCPDYIWSSSIQRTEWIKEIARQTRVIAETEKKSISVMWFVGAKNNQNRSCVFPWFHEQFEVKEVVTHVNRSKNAYESKYSVDSMSSLQSLEDEIENGNRNHIKYILYKPTEFEMLRRKEAIDKIGALAKKVNAVIILEGGILSHAYYQLTRTGAAIEVADGHNAISGEVKYDKLVRDNIPSKIKMHGEMATISKTKSTRELLKRLQAKIIEEALEVYDTNNDDSLKQELADLLEVFESILSNRGIPMEEVVEIKNKKREKSGGFTEGIVLERTFNRYYTQQYNGETQPVIQNATKPFDVWTDTTENADSYKKLIKLRFPVHLGRWETTSTYRNPKKKNDIKIRIKGYRDKGSIIIELQISETLEQLSLFDFLQKD